MKTKRIFNWNFDGFTDHTAVVGKPHNGTPVAVLRVIKYHLRNGYSVSVRYNDGTIPHQLNEPSYMIDFNDTNVSLDDLKRVAEELYHELINEYEHGVH